MLAVVKTPRTRRPSLEVRGRIPKWMLLRLRKEYGKNLVVKEDPEERVDVFQTSWYTTMQKKRHPGHSIRVYRENAGFSQEQLGAKLGGVPRQNISAMEKGRRGISKEMAKNLSTILKAPVERFI